MYFIFYWGLMMHKSVLIAKNDLFTSISYNSLKMAYLDFVVLDIIHISNEQNQKSLSINIDTTFLCSWVFFLKFWGLFLGNQCFVQKYCFWDILACFWCTSNISMNLKIFNVVDLRSCNSDYFCRISWAWHINWILYFAGDLHSELPNQTISIKEAINLFFLSPSINPQYPWPSHNLTNKNKPILSSKSQQNNSL